MRTPRVPTCSLLDSTSGRESLQRMKEELCTLSKTSSGGAETVSEPAATFTLADGQQVVLQHAHRQCAELLIDPTPAGFKLSDSVPGAIIAVLEQLPVQLQATLLSHVLLTGGTADLRGFQTRLHYELQRQYSGVSMASSVNVRKADEPSTAAWRGAAAMCSSSDTFARCTNRRE